MIRAAIYARYSSELQSPHSIEDQIRLCRAHAEREGWAVVKEYSDAAYTGENLFRTGIQNLIRDGLNGQYDVLVSEALDRISRDQEGSAHIYKRLSYVGVRMNTLSEGWINEMIIGFKGTMGALFLKDLRQKVHRGQRGRAASGKNPGGKSFGFDIVRKFDGNGEIIRGEQTINQEEAEVVRQIFRDYAKGVAPKKIAFRLNHQNAPSPSGKGWTQSTINGNRQRGTGILNNELYIGRQIWNRQRFLKDPDTGKRVARMNPKEEWVTTDLPQLRIVDQEDWDAVKERQAMLDRKQHPGQKQRPSKLFSFLLKCSECGGGFSKISAHHYGCSTARNKGTCHNRLSIRQDVLEQRVLAALQTQMMGSELASEFCTEYVAHINRLRMQHNASRTAHEQELERVKKEIEQIVDAIVRGIDLTLIKDRSHKLEARRIELEGTLAATEEAPVYIHPNMGERFHREIRQLISSLNDPDHRDEAATIIRKLIDKIVLAPNEDRTKLVIDLHGDLAGILQIAKDGAKKLRIDSYLLEEDELSEIQQVKMVAGVGFEPTTFRL